MKETPGASRNITGLPISKRTTREKPLSNLPTSASLARTDDIGTDVESFSITRRGVRGIRKSPLPRAYVPYRVEFYLGENVFSGKYDGSMIWRRGDSP